MEFALYYTLAAIVAYFLAAWILEQMEVAYGKRFPYRNFIFFFILFGLAYIALTIINPKSEPATTPEQQQPKSQTDMPDQ